MPKTSTAKTKALAVSAIQAIDVHGHYGTYLQEHIPPIKNGFMTGDAQTVVDRARQSNTELTIVSPLKALMPRFKADAAAGNEEAARVVPRTPGLLQWVVVNPLQPKTYDQAREMLRHPKCVGIKIHPEEHGYPIKEQGRKIFEFAEEMQALVLTHSGEKNSLPEDFAPFANDFPGMRLILAHLGCGWDADPTHQVRAIQAGKRGNLYVDTSSAQSILPKLIEWAVSEIGADRMLYGTDTPLYFSAMQRVRIDQAEIRDDQKRAILRDNALKLLAEKR